METPANTPSTTPILGTDAAKQARVVFLVNFVAPNHIAVLRNIAKSVGELFVLSSVEMESNRKWSTSVQDLNVVVQKTKTFSGLAKHPSGFSDANYIHIPWGTTRQLREISPDVVVSLEMGARTAFSAIHRALDRKCAFVTAVYASERSEEGRGFLRRTLRRQLIKRADWLTFNGPSCQRYLQTMGAAPDRMSAWNYAADPEKPFRGDREIRPLNGSLHLLTVGQLSERKGVVSATRQLAQWASVNSQYSIRWNVVGTGPQRDEMQSIKRPSNLQLVFHDHCDPQQLRHFYRDNDALLFPTLGDEWGLVTDEALHSGLPVIGSIHAQSVATLIEDDFNGWQYDPTVETSLTKPLNAFVSLLAQERSDMSVQARRSAADRTPDHSAAQFVAAVGHAIRVRHGSSKTIKRDPSLSDQSKRSPKHEMTVA